MLQGQVGCPIDAELEGIGTATPCSLQPMSRLTRVLSSRFVCGQKTWRPLLVYRYRIRTDCFLAKDIFFANFNASLHVCSLSNIRELFYRWA